MKCPVCKDTNLVMTERQSIEIDYCPDCRGVWLDRGELDKIIERSQPEAAPPPARASEPARHRDEPRDHRDSHYPPQREYRDSHQHKPYKRKSLLGELFDF